MKPAIDLDQKSYMTIGTQKFAGSTCFTADAQWTRPNVLAGLLSPPSSSRSPVSSFRLSLFSLFPITHSNPPVPALESRLWLLLFPLILLWFSPTLKLILPWSRGRPCLPHRLPSLGPDSVSAADPDDENPTPRTGRSRTRSTATLSHSRVQTLSSVGSTTPVPALLTVITVIRHRRVLASLLAQLSWRACWALLSTCRDCRDFFAYSDLKDVILSRFVPGYSACVRISDPLRLQHVPVTLADLNLLMISQAVILHRYPMHALTCISRLVPEVDAVEWDRTLKLATLAQAHSRFVLLLQALAHSSTLPPPPEKEELNWLPPLVEPQLRQLNFPAPLSYVPPTPSFVPPTPEPTSPPPSTRDINPFTFTPSIVIWKWQQSPASSCVRATVIKELHLGVEALTVASFRLDRGHTGDLRPPTFFGDSSSFSSSPSPPFSRNDTLEVPSPIRRSNFHHDLSLATSRTRAPILRVFVPCSKMDLSDDSDSIALCEDQLYESGLLSHLSTGDIVCNLGYVPPHSPDEPGSSSDGSLPDSAGSEHTLQNRKKWLIFNGESLVPFSPPQSLPLRDVFILPSPFYYSHIMPPRSDLVFTVRCFPPCDDIPQFTLVSSSIKVQSPHSPTGYALVNKLVWTARVWKQVAQDDEIGLGWQGEWVLEGEGTREGQRVLLDCLRGVRGPLRQWQLPSRKELRKQERTGLKQRKAEFFSAPHKRAAEEEHVESPQRKKVKFALPEIATVSKPVPSVEAPPTARTNTRTTEPVEAAAKPKPAKTKPKKTALEKLLGRSDPAPASLGPRSQKEKEEDAYIAYLEAKLGYGGKKSKKREDDGLDDLFDLADSLADSRPVPSQISESEDDENDDSEVESLSDANDDEEEWQGIDPEDVDSDEQDEEIIPDADPAPAAKPQGGTAYVPPHLRNRPRDEAESEVMIKLTRQVKGLLNRMTEQNISSILDSIEEIYRKHRRNDVTSTLTTLIVDGISSHSSLLDSYVVLYGAFVSSLHKIVGIEFAAFFIQRVVAAYEQHYADLKDVGKISDQPVVPDNVQTEASTSGKECSNLIVLLSELYNFQVISCVLVFDIIRGLLDTDLSEFSVELLLKIVRNSGQQLRQDDPSALKDIIQIVQNKISDHDEALSSRTRFMVETLTNLKNNKLKRNTTLNQGGEAVERMKKFLAGLSKNRHVMAHEPLRVSLQDLHSAESKGKWWLVGAAWGGDPLVDRQDEAQTKAREEPANESGNSALLKLARKQGMNTDIRRSIFVVLMSSDDYVDACERLSQLNLTEVQQREIVRVLLHCCGNEKSYNPYYSLVCQHLCRSSHSYKITLQFCLWDFLRDLGEANVGGAEVIKNLKDDDNEGFEVKNISSTRIKNVAKAYAWWVAKDCVTLGILKPVDFTTLKPQSREFLKELMVQLFVSSQVATPVVADGTGVPTTRNRSSVEEIFIKASRVEALAMGLVYFLTEAFRDVDEMPDGTRKLVKWASGVAKDTLRTGVDVVPSL
ncbi:MIF4G/MA4-domain-containing protein [Mycena venus]|uniref:MIF4G/MA4-domain-containing protein n=1 Tax=Mycena venus TaxID=2733690 RepID=A0A8H6X8T5_9AGAR|nr:MIF4G/MA4-domain-containing protein [Mycena venus]